MGDFENAILKIPDDIGYWLVRADGGKYYDDFFLNNFIAVSDNEITLELINKCAQGSIAGITIEHYKTLYSDNYEDWNPQQIAHAASRTFKFINEMKIGDIIVVPSKKSSGFLIGVLASDAYEISKKELNSISEVHYAINRYFKRRKVQWIKEVKRDEISEKLYWILSAHQTIFNLEEERDYINQLLAPIYVQNGLCHGAIKISKEEGLDSGEWYDLYSVVNKQSIESKEKVIVKSNVQSPGIIEFVSSNWGVIVSTTTILSGAIFGEVSFQNVKFTGILPYFRGLKREKLDMKKMEKELEILDEDKISRQLGNEKVKFELDKEKESWEVKKLENELERLRLQLQISSFDAGRTFEVQTQMDNENDSDAAES